ncbi:hypothetical protein BV898_14137 [Hypsibius exemplaris]|uniref:CCHC-type domain-containing protein n=1 Tax=Hypsibius exemplaris TaxID=2072580 RepID=A0A1W0W8M5_HYPEX|nr:hypothetical protein BV898_14137 [Hypsibius exemplaris]
MKSSLASPASTPAYSAATAGQVAAAVKETNLELQVADLKNQLTAFLKQQAEQQKLQANEPRRQPPNNQWAPDGRPICRFCGKVGHVSIRCLSSGRGASRGGGRGVYQNVNLNRQEWSQRPTSYGSPPQRYAPPYSTFQQQSAMSNQSPYQPPQYRPPIAPCQSQQMLPQLEQPATLNAVQTGSSFPALPPTETATFYASPQQVGQQQLEKGWWWTPAGSSLVPRFDHQYLDSGGRARCTGGGGKFCKTTRLPCQFSYNQLINNRNINNPNFHDGDGCPERLDATATVTVPVDLRERKATVARGGTDRVTIAEDLTDQSSTVGRDGSAGSSGETEGIVTRDQPRADGFDRSRTLRDNGEAVIDDATLADNGGIQPPTTRGTILYPDRAAEAAVDDGEDLPIWCPSAKKFDRMSPIDEPEVVWDKIEPLRQKAHWHKEEIRKQEVEMLAMRAFRPCLGSDWCSNVVLARKKDGTLRFAVDYGDVNQRTVKDQYPLARIDECLDAMKGCSWFTQIDLC